MASGSQRSAIAPSERATAFAQSSERSPAALQLRQATRQAAQQSPKVPGTGSGGARSENARSERLAAAVTQVFSNFRGTDIEGRELTASSLRGRVVVLDFWATWCAPCLKEVPTYQKLRRDYDASRLEIIGVSVDVLDRRGLVSWLNRQQVTWTQIHDRRGYSGELAQQFKVVSLPTTYVFDANGKMVAANVRGERLLQTVAGLLSPPAR
jgi:thiol-disulfide isomerase/thioredoxin